MLLYLINVNTFEVIPYFSKHQLKIPKAEIHQTRTLKHFVAHYAV